MDYLHSVEVTLKEKTGNLLLQLQKTNYKLRNGIKAFSAWPTIPQLYVKGEFVGGSDIMMSMHQSGELAELFQDVKKA